MSDGAWSSYLRKKQKLEEQVKAGKITKEQYEAWIECEKALMGKCFGCHHLDEFGGGACWSCGD